MCKRLNDFLERRITCRWRDSQIAAAVKTSYWQKYSTGRFPDWGTLA